MAGSRSCSSEDICGRRPIDLCSDQESGRTIVGLLGRSEQLKGSGRTSIALIDQARGTVRLNGSRPMCSSLSNVPSRNTQGTTTPACIPWLTRGVVP